MLKYLCLVTNLAWRYLQLWRSCLRKKTQHTSAVRRSMSGRTSRKFLLQINLAPTYRKYRKVDKQQWVSFEQWETLWIFLWCIWGNFDWQLFFIRCPIFAVIIYSKQAMSKDDLAKFPSMILLVICLLTWFYGNLVHAISYNLSDNSIWPITSLWPHKDSNFEKMPCNTWIDVFLLQTTLQRYSTLLFFISEFS